MKDSREPLREKNVGGVSAGRRNEQHEKELQAAVGAESGFRSDSGIAAGTDGKADAVEKAGHALKEYFEEDEANHQPCSEGGISEFRAAGGPLHCTC